eukprot:1976915-Amphidinium_carterae.1
MACSIALARSVLRDPQWLEAWFCPSKPMCFQDVAIAHGGLQLLDVLNKREVNAKDRPLQEIRVLRAE